ncbi:glycoside hydrolase family 43 protein [Tessaracoccus defluvii]|uniref:Family 43 glycosylhydrolase n=1 Tax=Tessaracoccus defluvii TaxID=1285901 RepID=A0A7H0H658_9ACTN|nr:glycoside hydrolase family 43 protein [Tessaracoccus defluvii]QNP56024.1 family 43 glycosylhydrolase [Tessaracoccus defluvii]
MRPSDSLLLPGFHPDPSVVRVPDGYVVACSSFEYFPGIPLYWSADLREWKYVGSAIASDNAPAVLADAYDSGGIYAPTLRYLSGRYFLTGTVFSNSRSEMNFFVTAATPLGPWSQPVVVEGARGMDPDIFEDDDGSLWWTGCRLRDEPSYEGETEVWSRELDPVSGQLVGPEYHLWSQAVTGAVWGEGPHLYRRGQWYYLLTAEGGTEENHAIVVARSRAVTGPYRGNPKNPILTHRHLGPGEPVANVGHADLFDDHDGQTWAVCLAVRPRDGHHILGRETFIVPVSWVDDWPVLAPGVGRVADPGTSTDARHNRLARSDATLSLRGPADFVRMTESGWVLHGADQTFNGTGTPSALFRRLTRWDDQVRVTLRLSEGAAGGLILRQSDASHLRAEIDSKRGAVELIERDAGTDTCVASVRIEVSELIELLAQLDGGKVTWFVNGQPLGETKASSLATEVAGGFVGTVAGPYVVGAGGLGLVTDWVQGTDQDLAAAGLPVPPVGHRAQDHSGTTHN